jgi:small-conductance mechanosensitive channel
MKKYMRSALWSCIISLAVIAAALIFDLFYPRIYELASKHSVTTMIAVIAAIWAGASVMSIITAMYFHRHRRPISEAVMVGRLYRLASVVIIVLAVAYGFGIHKTFGALFTLFGGMVLGWSLQAPVSGFAAWLLVSWRRPFRPGDRIQFPNLGLTGDVQDIGAMYVVLNQVGGTVGSEDAVGRHILVPNAMLFSQVIINYTVRQEAAYMLDEVVVRITFDSNIEMAEKILLEAARKVTGDVIAATGVQPYIRSDFWDYGLLMRLRFQTKVKERPRIAYEINQHILHAIQHTASVDLAIPFVYSYRAGSERKEDNVPVPEGTDVRHIDISKVRCADRPIDPRDIEQVAHSICVHGLLQPIVVEERADGTYFVVAGHVRFLACKHMGWKSIPAIVRSMEVRN